MKHRSNPPVGSRSRRRAAVLPALLTASLVLAGPSAMAKKNDGVKDKDKCRESSSVKLKIEPESGGILQVTAVVWSDDSDVWDWRMRHNDDLSARGTVKAKDADRSFKIVRDMADFTGPDEVEFRAENTSTGEVCRNTLTY